MSDDLDELVAAGRAATMRTAQAAAEAFPPLTVGERQAADVMRRQREHQERHAARDLVQEIAIERALAVERRAAAQAAADRAAEDAARRRRGMMRLVE